MIASLKDHTLEDNCLSAHNQFLTMLPQIRRQASLAFRHRNADARGELIQEVIANAYQAWVRLVKLGRAEMAFPTPLAQFAIRQVRAGRKVGSRQSTLDILSPCARRIYGFTIQRLDHRDDHSDAWQRLLVEDR